MEDFIRRVANHHYTPEINLTLGSAGLTTMRWSFLRCSCSCVLSQRSYPKASMECCRCGWDPSGRNNAISKLIPPAAAASQYQPAHNFLCDCSTKESHNPNTTPARCSAPYSRFQILRPSRGHWSQLLCVPRNKCARNHHVPHHDHRHVAAR
jgi:hypothetical protein